MHLRGTGVTLLADAETATVQLLKMGKNINAKHANRLITLISPSEKYYLSLCSFLGKSL
jgi:hypothetical protein